MKNSDLFNKLACKTGIFVKRNAPTILTGIGAAGVVGTAVMAAKAGTKASKLLDKAQKEKGEKLTTSEVVSVAGPIYIPSILLGAATIACLFSTCAISNQRQASLIGAYTMLDQSFKNYKEKVKEVYGEDANEKIVDEIAKENYPRRS